jgi:gamma-glutamylputrescine oxidase
MSRQPHPPSFYAATANGTADRPELDGTVDCDVCIVGGGFTGLSTALHLAERSYSVVLVEAERIGWGASGRNGGQVGSGLRIGPAESVAHFGRENARAFWNLAEEAKDTVRERIARHHINCDEKPGVLLAAAKPGHVAWMEKNVACRREVFGDRSVRFVARPAMREWVETDRYFGGVFDPGASHLHPLNYALGLARAAEDAGVRLYEGSRVTRFDAGDRPVVRTGGGEVRAHHAVLCCNAYLDRLEGRIAGKIMPIWNYIIATKPLGEARARALIPGGHAVCDTKFVVDYYRLSTDHRLLFGGGETYSGRERSDIRSFVRPYMLRVFPQLADAGIDYGWGGKLAITLNRLPHFGRLGGNVYFAQGFSGHGVALTSLAGKLIAEAISGDSARFDMFVRIPHRDFPGGTLLRKPGLVAGMLYYSLRDRL